MRIIIRLTVVLAIIAALVYGALYGYSWYKVDSVMKSAVKESSPYVDLSYSSVYVSPMLDGTIGVDGIVIRPKMTPDEFKIQSVRVTLPGTLALLTAKKGEVPESLRLAISGVAVDLNSPLLVSLSNMQKQAIKTQGRRGSPVLSYETLGCGSVDMIGLDELTRMGYQTLELDLDTEYHYAKVKNLLSISSVVRLKGMNSADLKAEIRIPPADLQQRKFTNAVIDSVRLDMSDSGYAALRNRFCAAQLQATEEDYLNKNIELLSQELGTTFPAETVAAYKKVMQGGRMHMEIAPKPGTELASLSRYARKDVIDMLGFKLVLDNHEVDFNKFEWGKSYVAAPSQGEEEGAGSAAAASVPTVKPAYVPATYHATSPASLGRYVGYKVRLKTRTGLDRDGTITNAEAGTITLRQTASAGKGFISFPIAIGDITKAEVLY